MSLIFFSCFAFMLSAIAYQDFRYRKISAWLLILLPACIVMGYLYSPVSGIHVSFKNILINSGFIGLLLSGVSIYFIIRNGHLTKIIDTYIGWGDVLFLFIATGIFSPVNFILFCIAGFLSAIILFGLVQLLSPNPKREIPLAGILSVVLLLGLSNQYITGSFNLQEDSFLLDKLTLLW